MSEPDPAADDPHDHEHPAPAAGALGIPRSGVFDGPAFERAIADLLRACGVTPDSAHTGKTPKRVRELWERRLLGGYEVLNGMLSTHCRREIQRSVAV